MGAAEGAANRDRARRSQADHDGLSVGEGNSFHSVATPKPGGGLRARDGFDARLPERGCADSANVADWRCRCCGYPVRSVCGDRPGLEAEQPMETVVHDLAREWLQRLSAD